MNKNYLRIKRSETAALIIDIQERLYPFIYENEIITANTVRLIKGLQILNIPMLVTQQYTKGLGGTIGPVKEALGNYEHIEKLSFSCCGETSSMNNIEMLNKKYIIISGIEAHVCVLQTCLDLLEKNYLPVVIEDCIGSRNVNNKKIAVERMRSAGAIISTYESILFELTVVSGTPEFKQISNLVK